jgi:serine/threonine-protein kinase
MTTPERLAQVQRFSDGTILGATISDRYVIERELGRGGMATVYLARDLRHGRQVALKVLEAHVAPDGAERFLREMHIAARLTHPHILGVHDSGEFDGRLFYVMPYVASETLRSRITRDGALPLGEAVRLTRELADALTHAHEAGVIHRDLKPENVLLSGGHAVVADFGIARAIAAVTAGAGAAASDRLTRTGVSLGTPAYMAPEQVAGDSSADHRADLYALGLTAYEMLVGAHPFAGRSTQSIAAAHLTETAPSLSERRPDVPAALSSLVAQLLAKDPAARPQSAEAVRGTLDDLGAPPVASRSNPRRSTFMIATAALAVVAVATYGLRTRANRASAPTEVRTVAVLPFANVGGGPSDDYFSDGLTDELSGALTRIPNLRLPGRTSTYAFKGKTAAAHDIGRALDVAAYISGSVRRGGDQLRVSTQLVSTVDGKVLWDSTFETHSGDVFAVQDSLTRAVVAALVPRLALPDSRANGRGTTMVVDVKRGTANEAAYQLYLQGMYYWHERGAANVKRSIDLFQQAIARDPTFGRAYAQLAFAYTTVQVYFPDPTDSVAPLISAAALRAITLDSTLSEAQHAAAASLRRDFRFAEAELHFRSALRIDPSNQFAHHAFGTVLLELGRTEEAISELRIATRLDPLAKSAGTTLAEAYIDARRFGEAETEVRRVLAIDSTFVLALNTLGFVQIFAGHPDSAVRTLERGARLYPESFAIEQRLLFAYAAAARWDDVDRMRGQLRQPGGDRTGGLMSAFADVVIGDREPLMRLVGTRDGLRRWITLFRGGGCNPLADPLWSDERYRAAMRGIGVAPCALAKPWTFPPRAISNAHAYRGRSL